MRKNGGDIHIPYIRQVKLRYLFDIITFSLIFGCLAWLIFRGAEQLGYNWQWYRIPAYLFSVSDGRLISGPLVEGLKVTLKISSISLVLAFIFGLTTAILRLSHSIIASGLARSYVEFTRNTPLLVQLFLIYFVLSPVLEISAFTSAVLALSLFEGAYASEIFRAGILSIPKHQWEASYSIGLNHWETYRLVILPQAIRKILPPLTSQAVSLIKDSALVSTIAIYDLTMQGQIIISQTFLVFEIWFTIAVIYLIVTVTLSLVVYYLEHRLRLIE